nr:MAG TPA: hypothetical protein [Caudoviricetes sp.]
MNTRGGSCFATPIYIAQNDRTSRYTVQLAPECVSQHKKTGISARPIENEKDTSSTSKAERSTSEAVYFLWILITNTHSLRPRSIKCATG